MLSIIFGQLRSMGCSESVSFRWQAIRASTLLFQLAGAILDDVQKWFGVPSVASVTVCYRRETFEVHNIPAVETAINGIRLPKHEPTDP